MPDSVEPKLLPGPARARARALTCRCSMLAALALVPGLALAARVDIQTGVNTQLTWTDNAGFQQSGRAQQEDTLLEVAPTFNINAEGSRLRITGSAVLSTLTYARGTQPSEFRPEGDLQMRLEGIERLFFIEAGIRSTQALESPFRPRPDGPSSFNTNGVTQARVTPYLQGNLGTNTRWQIRSDNTWTDQSDAQSTAAESDTYFARHFIEVERQPVPFGLALQLERDDTRYDDTALPSFTTDIARVIATYAFTPEFSMNVRGGYEWNNFVFRNDEGPIYGAGLTWRPSPRTNMTGFFEDRFFGSGWAAEFNHRMPRLAWNFSSTRDVGSFAQSLFELGPTANIAALLDAILTTRIPDPAARARAVQELIRNQGLPSGTATALTVFGQQISLSTAHRASVALIGARNTFAVGLFKLRTEELGDTTAIGRTGSAEANNTQEGVTLSLSHAISPVTSLNVTSMFTRVQSLVAVGDETSRQKSYRVQISRRLGPNTAAGIGARYQDFDSVIDGIGQERAVFVSFAHTFR